ncbi:MAG: hypothetical protein IJ249_06290 [Paludibacteraceae bacterium]|nr:hypothetical protein [Paludibacteraceae bacterium]
MADVIFDVAVAVMVTSFAFPVQAFPENSENEMEAPANSIAVMSSSAVNFNVPFVYTRRSQLPFEFQIRVAVLPLVAVITTPSTWTGSVKLVPALAAGGVIPKSAGLVKSNTTCFALTAATATNASTKVKNFFMI